MTFWYNPIMKITQLGQSGIVIEKEGGRTLAIDIGSYTQVEACAGIAPDAMLVSHIHGDHFSPDRIAALAPKKLYLGEECIEALGGALPQTEIIEAKAGETIEMDGFVVHPFEVDHGPNVTKKPRQNFGFLIEVDGQCVYFAGDMYAPSGMDVTALDVDVALLPVGGFYTFGPEEAVAFAKQFKSVGKVLPMHFEIAPEKKHEFIRLWSERNAAA